MFGVIRRKVNDVESCAFLFHRRIGAYYLQLRVTNVKIIRDCYAFIYSLKFRVLVWAV